MNSVHICFPKEVEGYRKGSDAEILAQIRTYGGFTVFWATDSMKRARGLTRLHRDGVIRYTGGGAFPWTNAEVVEAAQ